MKTRLTLLIVIASLLVSACSALPAGNSAAAQPASAGTVTPFAPLIEVQFATPAPDLAQAEAPASAPAQGAGSAPAPASAQPAADRQPPPEALAACVGQAAEAACTFTAQKGPETGVCAPVQDQLACSPQRQPPDAAGGNPAPASGPSGAAYTIDQAISDKAQGMTIAYDALAFLTGDLGADSFFPPGKVADFWGFQYLRDNDPSQMGHAGAFLTSAALNTLTTLTAAQRAELVALAQSQVGAIAEYGYRRFVLMQAFRRLMADDLPAGATGLSEAAVQAYSAQLYRLDGEISLARAAVMGRLLNALDAEQRARLDAMAGQGMLTWPEAAEPEDLRGLDRDVKVAVMTYAADMFSWYAGSVEADVYFCPERHGTYFGSFYLKDIRAMSDPTYAIPTNLTGDLGATMLQALTPEQAGQVTELVEIQKPALQGIVEVRRQVATELRRFLAGGAADPAAVLGLMEQYGALDGTIIYNLAVRFTVVARSLTDAQRAQLLALRQELLGDWLYPSGAYLYSQPISLPEIPNTDFLFQ